MLEETVVQTECFVQQGVQIRRHRLRRRHAGELRKLIDQRLQSLDLPDDRRRALVDDCPRFRRRVAEMLPDPLRTQLDGRQGVLDLVGQPPGHVAPRGDALGSNERRHIVEHHHGPFIVSRFRRPGRRGNGQVDLPSFWTQGHLFGRPLPGAAPGVEEHFRQRLQVRSLEHARRWLTDNRPVERQESRRGPVHRADPPVRIDRHHPGRDPVHDRLDVAPPLVDLAVLALQVLP